MVNKEIDKGRLQTYLGLIERHITDLEERVKMIEERMAVMKAEGSEIKPYAELLSAVLEVLETVETVRLGIMESLDSDDSME
jgi:hypothetical protein